MRQGNIDTFSPTVKLIHIDVDQQPLSAIQRVALLRQMEGNGLWAWDGLVVFAQKFEMCVQRAFGVFKGSIEGIACKIAARHIGKETAGAAVVF
ncbi:hypothetical protein D3C78_992030 [compost metagenome]